MVNILIGLTVVSTILFIFCLVGWITECIAVGEIDFDKEDIKYYLFGGSIICGILAGSGGIFYLIGWAISQ